MCAILGIISPNPEYLDKSKFETTLSKSDHRGPDGSSIQQITATSLFGFNRLAILDLSTASMQPFHYHSNYLVFNGEIYNYIELKSYLENKGVEFQTSGDVEVLAAGLTLEGVDFISKLNGMFAFCFYNASNNTFLIARDKLGVKPLFYYSDTEELIFSSEVKSILEYIPARLNKEMLNTHLYLDWFIGYQKTETFFQDIHSFPSGTYAIYNEVGELIKREKFYEASFDTTKTDINQIEAEFPRLLEQALEWENRSDAKVGIILSGGIDTSTNIALSISHLLKKQKTIPVFTYYYQDKGENTDLVYARKIINHLKQQYGDVFEVHEYNFDEAITLEDFEEAVRARETPVFDIRYITMTRFFRKVRESGVKVALSGQGSDEVYYGYYSLDYWLSKFYRTGELTTENVLEYFSERLNTNKTKVINPEYLVKAKADSKQHLASLFSRLNSIEAQPKLLTALIRHTMLPSFLLYEDKFSMYSGLEMRVPLINSALVEYIDSCDYRVNLISSPNGRHLFRKALQGKLPDEVINRDKTPTPKKKRYIAELKNIIGSHRDEILRSKLLATIYKPDFLIDITKNPQQEQSPIGDSFYGTQEDVLLELLGLFAFERVYLVPTNKSS